MFQTREAANDRRNLPLVADSSERLRASITNDDVLSFHRQQRGNSAQTGADAKPQLAGDVKPASGASVKPQPNPEVKPQPNPQVKPRDDKAYDPRCLEPINAPGTLPPWRIMHPQACGDKPGQFNPDLPPRRLAPGEKLPGTIDFSLITTATAFRQRVDRIFTDMDQNRDGVLTRTEVASAVQNKKYVGEDAQVVAGIFEPETFNGLVNCSDDQRGQETYLTRSDIRKMEIIEQSPAETAARIVRWMTLNFNVLDSDGNGYVHSRELEAIANDDSYSFNHRETAKLVLENYDKLQVLSNDEWLFENDGITRADIRAYSKMFESEFPKVDAIDSALETAERTFFSQLETRSDDLFVGASRDAIRPDAIKQGEVGNCYFLATLASLAKVSPERIERMIKDNKNGTYTVTFAGDPKHPVTVAAPTEAEQGLYNAGSEFGTWASIMERAFGKWRLERGNSRTPDALTLVEGGDGGDSSTFGMAVLTGNTSNKLRVSSLSLDEVAADLDFSLNLDDKGASAITASVIGDGNTTADGWYTGHLYSVLAFERTGEGDGWVTVRNPWGQGQQSVDGTKRIRLAEFHRNFYNYTIERRRK